MMDKEGMPLPQRYCTQHNEIWLDEAGVLWVCAHSMYEMDIDETKACFEVYRQMGLGAHHKVLQVIDARQSFTLTKEARDYVAEHGKTFFMASAIISNSLPVRLIINFFSTFYPNQVPLKIFGNEKEALKWLQQFKKDEGTTK